MQIPVAEIHRNPQQPRTAEPDVSDLVGSIPKVGLLQPIIVRKDPKGGWILIAGERRWVAHKKLELEVIEALELDVTDPEQDIARIMAENGNRQGFTAQEQAVGFQTMIQLGFSDEDMAAVSGAPLVEVKAARQVATAKKKAVAKMPATASMLEMAGLLEFDGDENIIADLTRNIGTANFDHRLAYWRTQRTYAETRETVRQKLLKAGVRIIPVEATYSGGLLHLDEAGLKQANVSLKVHARECVGHCAVVTHEGGVRYYCDKPRLHGLSQGKGPKSEAEKAEDRVKRENRAQWRATAPIRQEFITAKLKAKRMDPMLLEWAYAWAEKHGIEFFGGYHSKAKNYTEATDHCTRFVAICVSAVENAIDQWVTVSGCVTDPGWSGDIVGYLSVLDHLKYPLSDHERAVMPGDATAAA